MVVSAEPQSLRDVDDLLRIFVARVHSVPADLSVMFSQGGEWLRNCFGLDDRLRKNQSVDVACDLPVADRVEHFQVNSELLFHVELQLSQYRVATFLTVVRQFQFKRALTDQKSLQSA